MNTQCNPMLVTDVLDSLLATAVRAARIISPSDAPINLVNVLPRNNLPHTTLTAINRLPWIDMNSAARCGNLWLLDTLLKLSRAPYRRPLQYRIRDLMEVCAARGHAHVLEWWQTHGFHCSVTDVAGKATEHGHVEVLEWCLKLGKRLHVSAYATGKASMNGHAQVLQWLSDHDASMAVSVEFQGARDVVAALIRGDLAVVDWWLRSGKVPTCVLAHKVNVFAELAEIDYSPDPKQYREQVIRKIIDETFVAQMAVATCAMGDVDLIQLCLATLPQGLAHVFSLNLPIAYFFASAGGHTHVLDFLLAHDRTEHTQPALLSVPRELAGPSLPSTFKAAVFGFTLANLPASWTLYVHAADIASVMNHRPVLEWLFLHCSPGQLPYSEKAVSDASRLGHVDILRFWHGLSVDHGHEWRYRRAAHLAKVGVLDWWLDVFPDDQAHFYAALTEAGEEGTIDVFEWFAKRFSKEEALARLEKQGAWQNWGTVQWYLENGGTKLPASFRLLASLRPQPLSMILGCLAHGFGMEQVHHRDLTRFLRHSSMPQFLNLCIQLDLLPQPIDLDDIASGVAVSDLDLLIAAKHPVTYSAAAMEHATRNRDIIALDWWVRSGLKMKVPQKSFVQRVMDQWQFDGDKEQKVESEIVEWWNGHWYLLRNSGKE